MDMIYGTPQAPKYLRTGFRRVSLIGSTVAMPRLARDNPGVTAMRMPAT